MSDKDDRQRRLGDASNLHEAIKSLGKVSEEHRIGFVHDRLMSAIDDICTPSKANQSKFSQSQIVILKDIAFAMVYILDPRTQRRHGFFARLWIEYKEQTALKQLALASGALIGAIGIASGLYSGIQAARPWFTAALATQTEPATRGNKIDEKLPAAAAIAAPKLQYWPDPRAAK